MQTIRSSLRAFWVLAACTVWLALSPGTALAQQFEKVQGPLRPELPSVPFVGAAYGFIWIAILLYVLFVARGLSRVRGDLEELRRKLSNVDRVDDKLGGPGPRP